MDRAIVPVRKMSIYCALESARSKVCRLTGGTLSPRLSSIQHFLRGPSTLTTTIRGASGAPDSFLGTAGVDVIALQNQSGRTFLSARASDDTISFTSFTGVLSAASLYGGQGNDTLPVPANATTFSNGFLAFNEGNDTINLAGVTSSTIQGNQGNDQITTAALITASLINGNQNNDFLNINAGATGSSLFGGQGVDQFTIAANTVLAGGTRIQGNQDTDIINIGAGVNIQNTVINGNQGDDQINIVAGALAGFASSTIYGGGGNDTISTANAAFGVVISTDDGNDSVTGGAGGDTISNSAGNDSINAGNGNNSVTATLGNNTLTTGTGNDIITGGAGTDTITGGGAADTLNGGNGADSFTQGDGATAASTATTDANGVIANGETITVAADIIIDFLGGTDIMNTTAGTAAVVVAAGAVDSATNTGQILIRGNYAAGIFTADSVAGNDVLYSDFTNVAGAAIAAGTQTTLFQGQGANIAAIAAGNWA
jgi:Ca2+-binding RTX toxin-like protein